MGILFEIEYDNSAKLFYSGQVVSGRVIMESDKETRLHELLLRSSGKAEVSWTEASGHSGGKVGKTFSDEETYYDRRVILLEQTGPEDIIVGAGRNEYPFSLTLPGGIPSSFEGEHGNVRYYMEATIKRPKKAPHSVKSQFNVQGIVDLNAIPEAAEQQEVADEKHMCCFCCKSGPIGFHIKLEKRGYIAGESINIVGEVYNMSNTREVSISVNLNQTIVFHAKSKHTKTIETETKRLEGPKVTAGGLERWMNPPLELPHSLPPTKLAGCRIIDVFYSLQVELKTLRGSGLCAQIPIIVGTIPLGTRSEDIFIRRQN